ncbi:MAG: hypothetical protein HY774_25080 [Acidobacteria bacterium]|nr:hypothetical protein [Acidobacteriota bacterium]
MRQIQIRTAEGKKVIVPELNGSIGYKGQNQETEVRKVQWLLREVYAKGHFKGHFGADLIVNGNGNDGYTMMMIHRIQEMYKLPQTSTIGPASSTFLKIVELASSNPPLPSGKPDFGRMVDDNERFRICLRYIKEKAKGDVTGPLRDLDNGKKVIMSLRRENNTRDNAGRGIYDDLTMVMWKEKNVINNIRIFESNTEPSSRYEGSRTKRGEGNDVDGDGINDLGRVPDGIYQYSKVFHRETGRFGPIQNDKRILEENDPIKNPDYNILRSTKNIYAERDSNHDGRFDKNDPIKFRDRLNAFYTFYFHRGGSNSTGSAGCQTMKQAVFDRFCTALANQNTFYYVLVTVEFL